MPFPLAWRLLPIALILAMQSSAGQAEPSQPLWRFAHPNAKSLIGMDVRRIRESGLGRPLDMVWLESVAGQLPGLELLNQVDQVLISSPGSAKAADPAEPPILIAIRGQFDSGRVRRILQEHGAKAQVFDSVTVFRPQGTSTKEFGFALFNDDTILAGDAQSIFSSIERMRLPTGEQTSMIVTRAKALQRDYDFWAVMTEPGALASGRLPLAALARSGGMEGIRGLELGLAVRDGLSLNGELLMRSEYDTRMLKDGLAKLLKLAAKDQATQPELALFAKKLKLDVEPSGLKFSLRIGRTELEASLRNVRARHHPRESVVAVSKPIAPAKPQVIRIEGLDEGAREVKYGSFSTPPQEH